MAYNRDYGINKANIAHATKRTNMRVTIYESAWNYIKRMIYLKSIRWIK